MSPCWLTLRARSPRASIDAARLFRLLLLGGVAACVSAPPARVPAPAPCQQRVARVELSGGERLNARRSGEGLPVQLRLYQLLEAARLERASFEDIWDRDAEVLGEALVDSREVTVYPESRREISWSIAERAEVLVAVALFREPRGRDWTMSYSLSTARSQSKCPEPLTRVRLWVDGMKIRDGAGRPEGAEM